MELKVRIVRSLLSGAYNVRLIYLLGQYSTFLENSSNQAMETKTQFSRDRNKTTDRTIRYKHLCAIVHKDANAMD